MDDPRPAFKRGRVLLGFPVNNLADNRDILLKLLHADDLHLLFNQIGKRLFYLQLVHHPQGSPYDKACKVSLADIGGHNTVAQHIREAAGVIDYRVYLLDRSNHLVEFFGRNVDCSSYLLSQLEEI